MTTDPPYCQSDMAPSAQLGAENASANGYRDLLGYRLAEWSDGHAVIELDLTAQHLNRSGVLHGGVLATLIDTACGYSASWAEPGMGQRLCVTLSLTVSFTGQATAGRIRAIGRVKGGGRKISFCSAEVFDATGKLIAFGEGSFRYRTGSERPVSAG